MFINNHSISSTINYSFAESTNTSPIVSSYLLFKDILGKFYIKSIFAWGSLKYSSS
jgi:hypothetical protein